MSTKSIERLKQIDSLRIRAKTFSMLFGFHGDPATHLHNNVQLLLRPQSILLYTRPFVKLCAFLSGRAQAWDLKTDLIDSVSRGKADETALKYNISQHIDNSRVVESLRQQTADIAVEFATTLESQKDARVLINMTTLFLSVLDGDARITAVIRDNLICDATALRNENAVMHTTALVKEV